MARSEAGFIQALLRSLHSLGKHLHIEMWKHDSVGKAQTIRNDLGHDSQIFQMLHELKCRTHNDGPGTPTREGHSGTYQLANDLVSSRLPENPPQIVLISAAKPDEILARQLGSQFIDREATGVRERSGDLKLEMKGTSDFR